jgi:hypothetical protein
VTAPVTCHLKFSHHLRELILMKKVLWIHHETGTTYLTFRETHYFLRCLFCVWNPVPYFEPCSLFIALFLIWILFLPCLEHCPLFGTLQFIWSLLFPWNSVSYLDAYSFFKTISLTGSCSFPGTLFFVQNSLFLLYNPIYV